MSDDIFTASNGITIPRDERGLPTLSVTDREETQALREFFQHERDEELGRVRWPENPDVVIYQNGPNRVDLFNEQIAVWSHSYHDTASHESRRWDERAAKWWFDQNPAHCTGTITINGRDYQCEKHAHVDAHLYDGGTFLITWPKEEEATK